MSAAERLQRPLHVFTIGFTKKNAERFFTLLGNAGVKRVVDVRLNNVSQLAGFAKRDDLRFFLKELSVNHCVGVHSTVVSKRQLRNADITERIDPQVAFKKFLEVMDDDALRKKLEKQGSKIIEETR